jgi:glycosyltransferase involved in cell wall biosynthesis
MKIAFVGHKGIPAKYGGVEKHVEELGTRLAERGHSIITYTRSNYSNFKGYYKKMRIFSLPAIPQKHTEMISHTLFSLIDLLDKDIDIIHIHSVDPAILSFIPRINSKVVVTSHGQAYRRGKWGSIAKRFSRLAERAFAIFPDRRIAVSQTLKKYYEEKYNCKIIYIPNGIDVKLVNGIKTLKKLNLTRNEYLLFVGRIIPTKGCDTLVEAFKALNTDKKLVFVGGSSYTDNYFETLKKKSDERTIFLGYKYGRELVELYSNAYCFIIPSEIEGLALTLLEAMTYGKCVVYSDIPENEEVAHDVGIAFQRGNCNDLAAKLKFVLKNQAFCEETGNKARRRVQAKYNWDSIVNQTEDVYNSLFT